MAQNTFSTSAFLSLIVLILGGMIAHARHFFYVLRFQRTAKRNAPALWNKLAERPPLLGPWIPTLSYVQSQEARSLSDPTLRRLARSARRSYVAAIAFWAAGMCLVIAHAFAG